MFYFHVPSTSNPTTNTHTHTDTTIIIVVWVFPCSRDFPSPFSAQALISALRATFQQLLQRFKTTIAVCVWFCKCECSCMCVCAPLRDENSSRSDVDDTELTFREQFSHPLKTSGGVGGSNSTQLFKPQRKLAQKGGGGRKDLKPCSYSQHITTLAGKHPPPEAVSSSEGSFLKNTFPPPSQLSTLPPQKSTSGGGGKSFPTFHSKLSAFREERWGKLCRECSLFLGFWFLHHSTRTHTRTH